MDVLLPVTNEEAVDRGFAVDQVPEAYRLLDSIGVWMCVDDLEPTGVGGSARRGAS